MTIFAASEYHALDIDNVVPIHTVRAGRTVCGAPLGMSVAWTAAPACPRCAGILLREEADRIDPP